MRLYIVLLNFDFYLATSARPFAFDCGNYFLYNISRNILFLVDGFNVLRNYGSCELVSGVAFGWFLANEGPYPYFAGKDRLLV